MTVSARGYAEKRDFRRIPVDCALYYGPPDAATLHQGRCVNLSAGGLLFQTDEAILVGALVRIKVVPGLDISPPLSAITEVVRLEAAVGEGYRVAVAIKQIDA